MQEVSGGCSAVVEWDEIYGVTTDHSFKGVNHYDLDENSVLKTMK